VETQHSDRFAQKTALLQTFTGEAAESPVTSTFSFVWISGA
jgi:hypothetical protein